MDQWTNTPPHFFNQRASKEKNCFFLIFTPHSFCMDSNYVRLIPGFKPEGCLRERREGQNQITRIRIDVYARPCRGVTYMLRSNDGLRLHAVESAAEILGDLPPFAFAGGLDPMQTSSLDDIEKLLLEMLDRGASGGDREAGEGGGGGGRTGGDGGGGDGGGGGSEEVNLALCALVELAVVRGSLKPILRIVEKLMTRQDLCVTPPMFRRLNELSYANLPLALRKCFPAPKARSSIHAYIRSFVLFVRSVRSFVRSFVRS